MDGAMRGIMSSVGCCGTGLLDSHGGCFQADPFVHMVRSGFYSFAEQLRPGGPTEDAHTLRHNEFNSRVISSDLIPTRILAPTPTPANLHPPMPCPDTTSIPLQPLS